MAESPIRCGALVVSLAILARALRRNVDLSRRLKMSIVSTYTIRRVCHYLPCTQVNNCEMRVCSLSRRESSTLASSMSQTCPRFLTFPQPFGLVDMGREPIKLDAFYISVGEIKAISLCTHNVVSILLTYGKLILVEIILGISCYCLIEMNSSAFV